jgi:HK97 family phage portal protein
MKFWPWKKKASNSYELFKEIYGGKITQSGKTVNINTALEVSTVLACVKVIAEGISQVPLKLMKDEKDGTKLPAKTHPLYDVLSVRANPWQTSFEFRETMGLHVALCGNFYAFKNAVGAKIRELIPFAPSRVKMIQKSSGVIVYEIEGKDGQKQEYPESMIWHVKGPSWDNLLGMDTLNIAREAVGLAMATEQSTSQLQKNGVRNSGVYSVEGNLSAEQYKALQKWIADNYEGSDNTGKTMILDRGAKWLNTQMSSVDSQHLETRRFQIEEICRFFRVMPIMVGHSDKAATYASSEQMFLAHVVHTLAPWYARIEQSIDANLLTPAERAAGYYSDFVEEALLRGDAKTTAEVLVLYSSNGILTRNEARQKLDMNKIEGLDTPLTPANLMGDMTQTGEENAA